MNNIDQQTQQKINDLRQDITTLSYIKNLINDTEWKAKKPNGALLAINARIITNRALIVKLLKQQKGGES